MEKIEKLEALQLENFSLKRQLIENQLSSLTKEETDFVEKLKEKYNIQQGDAINPQTFEILRAPQTPEAK